MDTLLGKVQSTTVSQLKVNSSFVKGHRYIASIVLMNILFMSSLN